MRFFTGFFVLVLLLTESKSFCQDNTSNNSSHAIALVLKVEGDENKINAVSTYHYTSFNGRIKESYLQEVETKKNYIKIFITDREGVVYFNGYVANPLHQKIEAFNPDGTIEGVDWKKKEEYINLRFYLPETVKNINVSCHSFNDEGEEALISEFKLDIK